MADSKEKLFPEFPPVSTQQWMEKATADLKGADFEKKLVWKTNEGFKVQPFYRMENLEGLKSIDSVPGQFPFLRGIKQNNNEWLVRQDIQVECPKEANAKALDILNKGIDSLGFRLKADNLNAELIETLLEGICAECVELNFTTCQKHVVELANLLTAYFTKKDYDLKKLNGSINFDPMSKMLAKGKERIDLTPTAQALLEATKPLPRYRVLGVNALALNNAGASIYQELGYALAWGNEYLHRLTEAGAPAAHVAKSIKFNFGISSNYFLEIAKFRAARMLWANIVAAYNPECDCADGSCDCGCGACGCGDDGKCDESCDCGCQDGKECTCGCQDGKGCRCAARMHIHAETSSFNLTLFDPYVNLLRTQTESMSAALAGVESMTVSPFDKIYADINEFSERLARNQQLLLKEESHFDKVIDPAAGSYYIETLTVSIAKQAWELFLATEEAGGFYAAIKAGTVQTAVNESNQARHTAMAQRREILLGTNQYPNFTELTGDKKPVVCACGCKSHEGCEPDFPTLNIQRAADQFEALRLQTEASGKRPKAFMLTIGNLAMRQARAQFSCNFLACAGYEVIDNLGFDTVEAGIEAAMTAQADIVVLCSSDDEYATYAVPAYKALNGRALFIVAGAPACMDELKAAGIENFIHVRVNVLETLRSYNAKLLK
ncbi:MAG: methylmalonyl-CoA mutase family protein [Prevotellaceae bacterium]|jgi:methylmalonyl-CoA mutase|nr:methylmalonyl-CoA mutase family protein [Prevotellaceae bacterium]